MKRSKPLLLLAVILVISLFYSCGDKIILPPGVQVVPDDTIQAWSQQKPSKITFFVEASGSMNGFFRGNKETHFKTDVWSIMGNFKSDSNKVKVFKDAKDKNTLISFEDFRVNMNGGKFVSSGETIVPDMFKTVLEDIDLESGECVVLISDMIYSPVGNKDLPIRLAQYETDIRDIAKIKKIPISIVCAVSNFLDKNGKESVLRSPYYYLIIGNKENVSYMKNCIATILKDEPEGRGEPSRYVNAVDFGITYGNPSYSFLRTEGVYQKGDGLAFIGYNKSIDSCSVEMKIYLSAYPWSLANSQNLDSLLEVRSEFGSEVSFDIVNISDNLHYKDNLSRFTEATIFLRLSKMPLKADIIDWRIKAIPNVINSEFENILKGTDENDRTRTFTMRQFLSGLGHAYSSEENEFKQILISTTK